jgi:serine/threonine protein kinase
MIGKTIAHYEITSLLGKGGMGEVYQAKDTKLGRDVAIKVLPDEFASDADRVARFQREAKLLASLNHPNIASIHGLEESENIHFLVMELVEGNTLADLIKTGPIPVEEALKLALQIAEALEAAHEKGVIHRDLKPANIKVTPEGKVKILDFGLAKAFAEDQGEMKPLDSPTISAAATQKGVILGTAAYMSPEQARGKPVDKRTDIWAFGCVLYEMLTSRVAFQGEDVSEILASVIKGDMKLDLLPANLHPRVREAIVRCLKKDLNKRYLDIRDAQYEIEQVLSDPGGIFVQPVTTAEPRINWRTVLPLFAAALVIGAILAGSAVWTLKQAPPTEPKRVVRFAYDLPEGQQFNQYPSPLAISPDGRKFVYCTTAGLYLRSMDQMDARHIAGTDKYSHQPFFSPDGKWIGYFSQADKKLIKIAISGGAPFAICDVSALVGAASWGADDAIIYSDGMNGIMRVSAEGGIPECLIKADVEKAGESGFPAFPQILPDGKNILFTNLNPKIVVNSQIMVQSLESGERNILISQGGAASYLPTGHLVYVFGINGDSGISTGIAAVPFDLHKLKVTGTPVSILQDQVWSAVSASGTLVYISSTTSFSANRRALVWVDREGNEEPLSAPPDNYIYAVKISPDGMKLALNIETRGNQDIYIWDLNREIMSRLTFDDARDIIPLWTPDNRRIVYESIRGEATTSLKWKAANGIGEAESLCSLSRGYIAPWSWSGDDSYLVNREARLEPYNHDISILSMKGDRERKLLLHEEYSESQPQVSSDGKWMAYQSDRSGRGEIYVRPFPDVDKGRWQVSSGGGNSPLWSPNGRELFYRNGDATIAVAIENGPIFKPGKSKILFRGDYYSTVYSIGSGNLIETAWDISPDGKRFLMIKTADNASSLKGPQQINVVVNWVEELKRPVPVK